MASSHPYLTFFLLLIALEVVVVLVDEWLLSWKPGAIGISLAVGLNIVVGATVTWKAVDWWLAYVRRKTTR